MKSDKSIMIERGVLFILSFLFGVVVCIVSMKKWDLATGDTVAFLVAAAAFISSFYHFYSMRRHQRLSVKPKFQISNRFDSTEKEGFYTFRVILQNVGLGPGEVESKTMKLGKAETSNVRDEFEEWTRLVNKILPKDSNPECHTARCNENYSINNNTSIDLLLVRFPKTSMSFMDARDMVMFLNDEISINITYVSMYGNTYSCQSHLTKKTM